MSKILNIMSKKIGDKEVSQGLTTFVNSYTYLFARKNTDVMEKMDFIFYDGIVLSTLIRLIGIKSKRKSFDMTSLAPDVFYNASRFKESIYFIGGEDGIVTNAVKKIKCEFHEVIISGTHQGYFPDINERNLIINDIVLKNPDIVVVGMGAPFQEKFLLDLQDAGWRGKGYTCGGFLHQTAGKGINYYPKWINKCNLRWAYRAYDEPRILKRLLIFYPKFLILFMIDAISFWYLKVFNKRKI